MWPLKTHIYLTSFFINNKFKIHCSKPTPLARDDQMLAVNWDPVDSKTPQQLTYLDIGTKLDLKKNPEQERMEFWDDLYQQYNAGMK